MTESKKTIGTFNSFAIIILLSIVVVQTAFQVKKFLSGKTTMSKTSHIPKQLFFPHVSFCPGFKKEEMAKYPWMLWENLGHTPFTGKAEFPQDSEEAENMWNDVTFKLEEIVSSVTWWNESRQTWHSSTSVLENNSINCLNIQEFNTLSGKCYSFLSPCSVTNSEGFALYMNLSSVHGNELSLMFHHPRAHLGMNQNYWPTTVGTSKVEMESTMKVLLRKQVKQLSHGHAPDSYFDCLKSALDADVKKVKENNSFCYFPSFESILHYEDNTTKENSVPCTTPQTYTTSIKDHMYRVLFRWYRSSTCGTLREQETYKTAAKVSSNNVARGMSVVYVSYESDEIDIEEEYILLDMPALLSAIGGFAGMLLGWSVRDFVIGLIALGDKKLVDKE